VKIEFRFNGDDVGRKRHIPRPPSS
jgi:hypothetical protein